MSINEVDDRGDGITFVLGTGNQSAICGGVIPMKVAEIADPSAESSTGPDADPDTPVVLESFDRER